MPKMKIVHIDRKSYNTLDWGAWKKRVESIRKTGSAVVTDSHRTKYKEILAEYNAAIKSIHDKLGTLYSEMGISDDSLMFYPTVQYDIGSDVIVYADIVDEGGSDEK